MATFDSLKLMNMATFFDQTKYYSTQKERLFQMASFKFHEKNHWESSKLTNSKITPSRENHAHFISCKPPHKTHPREYLVLHFLSFKLQHQLLRNLKFYQLHFIWVPLYLLLYTYILSSYINFRSDRTIIHKDTSILLQDHCSGLILFIGIATKHNEPNMASFPVRAMLMVFLCKEIITESI